MPNCNADDKPCMGASSPSGTDLHLCEAVHAEQNALMQCADVQKIDTIYVTVSPCIHCMKMIINTSCRRIVYNEIYSEAALDMWDDHCARLNHV
jgi:dCMP deaminase